MAKLTNSPKQQLGFDLERRKSFTFRCSVVNSDGNAVDLTGCTLRFVLKPATYDDDQFDVTNLLVNNTANIPEPELGYGVFSFQAAELDRAPGEYYGSIVLWTPAGYSITLTKGVVNLMENTESDSMHLQYSTSAPPSEVEITLRGEQAVSVVTDSYGGRDPSFRGPCVRTVQAELDPTFGALNDVQAALFRAAAYPDGRPVEIRDGDLVFSELTPGVAAVVMSITGTNVAMVTRVTMGGV